eukprot:s3605_g5.t1
MRLVAALSSRTPSSTFSKAVTACERSGQPSRVSGQRLQLRPASNARLQEAACPRHDGRMWPCLVQTSKLNRRPQMQNEALSSYCLLKWRQVLLSKEIQEHSRWHLATCLVCEVASVTLNAIIVTALINSCARKSSQTRKLRRCVRSVSLCDLVMPLGYWEWSACLLDGVRFWSLQADVLLHNAVLRSFCGKALWAQTMVDLELMGQRALLLDAYSASASMKACESGGWRVAAAQLQSFLQLQLEATAVNSNILVAAFEAVAKWQQPLSILGSMYFSSLQRTVVSVASAIAACGSANHWQHALALLHSSSRHSLEANLVACNAAASACEKPGQWRQAAGMLVAMRVSSLEEDCISCNAVISSLEKGGLWTQALGILDSRFRRMETSVVTYSAVISTCETAGRWREALHMLGLPDSRVEPNCYTYNSAISACEKARSWAHAVWLLSEMKMRSLQLDLISYNAALSTCSVSSKWTLALSLMSEMSGYNLQMDVITYEVALAGLEKGSCSLSAVGLLYELEAQYLQD